MSTLRLPPLDPDVASPYEFPAVRINAQVLVEFDAQEFIDQLGRGVTITGATWAVHPDDAANGATIDLQTINGLFVSARFTGGTANTSPRYSVIIDSSDGQRRPIWFILPTLDIQPT